MFSWEQTRYAPPEKGRELERECVLEIKTTIKIRVQKHVKVGGHYCMPVKKLVSVAVKYDREAIQLEIEKAVRRELASTRELRGVHFPLDKPGLTGSGAHALIGFPTCIYGGSLLTENEKKGK